MTTPKIWSKPTISATPIRLAAYFTITSTDAGAQEHRS
jgi:hypothetical protein